MAFKGMKDKAKTALSQTRKGKASSNNFMAGLMMLCVLVVVISFVASKQLVGDVGFNNKVISAKNRVNATLQSNIDAIEPLKSNFNLLDQDGPAPKTILEALPVEQSFPELSANLETISASAGAVLSSVVLEADPLAAEAAATTATSPVALPQALSVRINVAGSYTQLQRVLAFLQVAARPVVIKTVTFSGTEPNVVMDLSFTTFYQAPTVISDATETLQ